MTKERYQEIVERITKLEDLMWDIELIDHWTREDEEYYDKYLKEFKALKQLIIDKVFE